MDRSELQHLYDRAVGNGRRYWADRHVQNLVTAVGDYLAQDDPTVEIAYLRATIADLKAETQQVQASREDLARAAHSVSGDLIGADFVDIGTFFQEKYFRIADAVLALFASQPTVAEVRAEALGNFEFAIPAPAAHLDRSVRAFKTAWHQADIEGRKVERVADGLRHVFRVTREALGGSR